MHLQCQLGPGLADQMRHQKASALLRPFPNSHLHNFCVKGGSMLEIQSCEFVDSIALIQQGVRDNVASSAVAGSASWALRTYRQKRLAIQGDPPLYSFRKNTMPTPAAPCLQRARRFRTTRLCVRTGQEGRNFEAIKLTSGHCWHAYRIRRRRCPARRTPRSAARRPSWA